MAQSPGQIDAQGHGAAPSGWYDEWEHRVRRVRAAAWADDDDAALAAALDADARDGWELVGVAPVARPRRPGGMTAFGPDEELVLISRRRIVPAQRYSDGR
jgi:hypothetical protein